MASKKQVTRQLNIFIKTVGLDKATATLKDLNEHIKMSATEQNKAKRTQDSLGRSTVNTTKSFAKQAQGLGGLVRFYATWAANLFAVTAAFGALKRAADLQILINQTRELGIASGVSFQGVANNLKEITAGALTARDALASASLGLNAGLGGDQIEKLTKSATILAQTLGRSVPESVNRMIQAVVKGESELLDELGIVLRLDKAYAQYAENISKVTKDLTVYERQQATVNAVLEQAEEKTKGFEVQENDFDKLSAAISDLSSTILKVIAGPLGSFATFLSDNILALVPVVILGLNKIGQNFIKTGAEASRAIDKTTAEFDKFASSQTQRTNIIISNLQRMALAYKTFGAAASVGFNAAQLGFIGDEVRNLTGDIADFSKNAGGKVTKVTKSFTSLGAAMGSAASFALKLITRISVISFVFTLSAQAIASVLKLLGIFNDYQDESSETIDNAVESQELLMRSYEQYQKVLDEEDSSLERKMKNYDRLSSIFKETAVNIDKVIKSFDKLEKADFFDRNLDQFMQMFGYGDRANTVDLLTDAMTNMLKEGFNVPNPDAKRLSGSAFGELSADSVGSMTVLLQIMEDVTYEMLKQKEFGAEQVDFYTLVYDRVKLIEEEYSSWSSSARQVTIQLERGKEVLDDFTKKATKNNPFKKTTDILGSLMTESKKLFADKDLFGKQNIFADKLADLLKNFKEVDSLFRDIYKINIANKDVFNTSLKEAMRLEQQRFTMFRNFNLEEERRKEEIISLNAKISEGQIGNITKLGAAERALLKIEYERNEARINRNEDFIAQIKDETQANIALKMSLKDENTILEAKNATLEDQIRLNNIIKDQSNQYIAALKNIERLQNSINNGVQDQEGFLSTKASAEVLPRGERALASTGLITNEGLRLSGDIESKLIQIQILQEEINKNSSNLVFVDDKRNEISRLQLKIEKEKELSLIKQEELRRAAIDSTINSNDFSVVNFQTQFAASMTREAQKFSIAMDSHVKNVQKVVLNTFDAGIDDFTNALVNDGKFNVESMKDALRTTLAEITSDYLKQAVRQLMSNIFDPQLAATNLLTAQMGANSAAVGALTTIIATGGGSGGSGGIWAVGSVFGGSGGSGDVATAFPAGPPDRLSGPMIPLPGNNAKGGVIDKPMVSWIAEGGQSEAVVPLPDNRSIPVELSGDSGNNYNVTQNFDFSGADKNAVAQLRAEANRIKQETINTLLKDINRGGQSARITGRRR